MKSLVAFAAVVAVAAVAAPAFAQTTLPIVGAVTYNGSVGYTGLNTTGLDLGAATLRAGADFAKYFGVEAEGSFGVVDANAITNGTPSQAHENDQYALYGVVRYPFSSDFNLFARGGYGHTDIKVSPLGLIASTTSGADSWNYGAGAEYFFDGKNGVRVDYTRVDFQDRGLHDGDSVALSYVHKF